MQVLVLLENFVHDIQVVSVARDLNVINDGLQTIRPIPPTCRRPKGPIVELHESRRCGIDRCSCRHGGTCPPSACNYVTVACKLCPGFKNECVISSQSKLIRYTHMYIDQKSHAHTWLTTCSQGTNLPICRIVHIVQHCIRRPKQLTNFV